ncbi:hypothetical protein BDB01DRAFT_894387, partial [Pilobolus umbonatus]
GEHHKAYLNKIELFLLYFSLKSVIFYLSVVHGNRVKNQKRLPRKKLGAISH